MRALRAITATIPIALCGAIYLKTHDHNDKQLIYVHLFHRHGNKTPSRLIGFEDKEFEQNLWIKRLSKQYYCTKHIINQMDNNNHTLNHWININHKLNGSYIEPTIDINNGVTTDNKKNGNRTFQVQLTQNGVIKLQNLGLWLRSRYIDEFAFLSPTYTYNETTKLYIQSSNANRCIFSVDSLLNGLYNNHQRYKAASIPIHIDPQNNHYLSSRSTCEKHRNAKRAFKHELRSRNLGNDISEIHNKLTNIFKDSKLEFNVEILSTLRCRIYEDMVLPSNIDNEDVLEYSRYTKHSWLYDFIDRNDMLMLTNGVLLKKLLYEMKYDRDRFVISSGHDWSIARLICCLLRHCKDEDMINEKMKWPQYGANIIFEVWQFKNNKRMVRVLHNKEIFKINGREFVELSELEHMWKSLILNEKMWSMECVC